MESELEQLRQKNIELKKRLREIQSEKESLRQRFEASNENRRTLAHDLKSPITGIKLISETLIEELEELRPEKVSSSLEKIATLANKMARMVRQLIEQDKDEELTADQQIVSMVKLSVPALISNVFYEFEPIAARKGITLKSAPSISQDLTCLADRDLIDLVLSNLVSNAIKYSPQGSTVMVGGDQFDQHTVLHVIDRGVGMTEADLETLFNSYATASSEPTDSESKTGLGLYIAKQMVERMKGTLKATSEGKGKGVVFTITLLSGEDHG